MPSFSVPLCARDQLNHATMSQYQYPRLSPSLSIHLSHEDFSFVLAGKRYRSVLSMSHLRAPPPVQELLCR